MAYCKLTSELVEKLQSFLADKWIYRYEVHDDVGLLKRPPFVRDICSGIGISHMTFYRWLREYRTLIAAEKSCYTEREQLLLSFGNVIADLYRISEDFGETGVVLFELNEKRLQEHLDFMARHRRMREHFVAVSVPKTSKTSSDPEVLTDALTKGFGRVCFSVPQISLKNM